MTTQQELIEVIERVLQQQISRIQPGLCPSGGQQGQSVIVQVDRASLSAQCWEPIPPGSSVVLLTTEGGVRYAIATQPILARAPRSQTTVLRRRRPRSEPMVAEMYIVDSGNRKLKFLDRQGQVTTVASEIGLYPYGLAIARDGTLYLSDFYGSTIWRILPGGSPQIIVGSQNSPGRVDGIGTAARLLEPRHIALDPAEQYLYVSEVAFTVRRITLSTMETRVFQAPEYFMPNILSVIIQPPGNPESVAFRGVVADENWVYTLARSDEGSRTPGRIRKTNPSTGAITSIYVSADPDDPPYISEDMDDLILSEGRLYVSGGWRSTFGVGPTEGFVKSMDLNGGDVRLEWREGTYPSLSPENPVVAAYPQSITRIGGRIYGALPIIHRVHGLSPFAALAGTGTQGDEIGFRTQAQFNQPSAVRPARAELG